MPALDDFGEEMVPFGPTVAAKVPSPAIQSAREDMETACLAASAADGGRAGRRSPEGCGASGRHENGHGYLLRKRQQLHSTPTFPAIGRSLGQKAVSAEVPRPPVRRIAVYARE